MSVRGVITQLSLVIAILAVVAGAPSVAAASHVALPDCSGPDLLAGATEGADTLVGTPGDDIICSLGGADVIDGKGGDDVIIGGSGNDRIVGGAGADLIAGGTGTDLVDYYASTSRVVVTIGSGDDNDGASGEGDEVLADIENLRGGPKSDELTGDADANALAGGPGGGKDQLTGGGGNDALFGGAGGDSFDGGSGSDLASFADRSTAVKVTIGDGANDGTNDGAEGDDVEASVERVIGTLQGDDLTGDAGTDELRGSGGPDTMRGGPGDDILDGDGGADTYVGGTGSDLADYQRAKTAVRVSIGGGANDGANGGAEGDNVGGDMERVRGGSGDDKLYGNKRSNTLYGGPGDDQLSGGDANDTFFGDAGADLFNGGAGTDHVSYRETLGAVKVTVGSGANDGTNNGNEGDDVQGTIEVVSGSSFGDDLRAGAGAAQLYGHAGPDILVGGSDADILVGDDGLNGGLLAGDQIIGGNGIDYLAGGAGADYLGSREPGTFDTVDCGAGTDYFDADPTDDYDADCEDGVVVATADSATATEDTALPIDVLANDLNLRLGDAIVTNVNQPPAGEGTTTFTDSGVTYTPPADFSGGPVTFTYETSDGNTSDTGNVSVTVNADNDAPVVAVDGALDHTEGDGKEFVDQSLTLTDVDDVNMESATVQITGGYASGEDVLDVECASCLSPVTSLTASQSGDTLTISGTGTIAEYLEALQGVRYENTSDDPSTAQRTLSYKANDGDDESASDTATVSVAGANDAPSDLAISSDSVNENQPAGTTVGTLSATDPDDTSHTFSLVDTGDDDSFTIDGTALKTAAAFDKEAKDTYSIRVRAEDGDGAGHEKDLTVSVTDVNEAPSFTSSATPSAAENQTSVVDVDASDPEGATPTFSITGGADAALFSINGTTGALEFLSAPDFESPADAGANNVYDVQVTASDGTHSPVQNVAVTVTNANEAPSGLALDDLTVDENHPAGTPVGKASANDPDGDSLTYSLVSGTGDADNAKFQFSNAPGDSPDDLATAVANLNHENPLDANSDGNYQVRIQASDGSHTVEEAVTITVNDLNDAPTDVQLDPSSVAENSPAGTEVGELSSLDEDSPAGTYVYSLASGAGDADNGSFEIDGDKLKTKAGSSFDYETKTSFATRVKVVDSGGPEYEQQITVSVTNVNEPPALGGIETADLDYQENQDKLITNDLTVSEPEGDLIASATVKVTTAYNDAQDRLKFTDTATIEKDGAFDTATGTLTLRGAGGAPRSAAAWQTALRAVTYENTSENPDTTKRTISFKVTDAGSLDSNTVTRDMTVTRVNDAPTTDNETAQNVNRAVGNTALVLNAGDAEALDPAGPQKTVSIDVLDGDGDVDGPNPLTVVDAGNDADGTDGNTADGGTVTVDPEGDGDLTYFPKAGTSCTDQSDSFKYRVSDGATPTAGEATGTVTVTLADCVWYVDAGAAAPAAGTGGRSNTPFPSLAGISGAGDPDTTGDKLFVYPGTYSGGLTLEDTQKLFTKGHGLKVDNGNGDGNLEDLTLEAKGIANSTINGGLVLAANNTVQGVDLGQHNGVSLFGTNVGTATVGTATPGLINNGSGQAVGISGGTLDMAFTSVISTNSLADGIRLDNTTGTFTASAGAISNATGQDVDISGNDSGDDVNFTYGGSISDDTGELINVSDQTGGLKDFNGTVSDGNDGDGAGIRHSSNSQSTETRFDGVVTLSTGTNNALTIHGPGIVLIPNSGSAITTTSGKGVDVSQAGSGTITVNAPIATQTGSPVSITDRTGGDILFPRAVTNADSGGNGIVLTSNGSTPIRFMGAVDIDTNGTPAVAGTGNPGSVRFTGGSLDLHNANGRSLQAMGGGSIEVSGASNVLDSDAGGGALEVSGGTQIADNSGTANDTGLRFQKIDSAGGTNGIKLDATGTGASAGSLTIEGTGTAGSGGTISSTAILGAGILLNDTKAANLNRVLVQNNVGDGIHATTVPGGFTLANSTVSSNGNAHGDNDGDGDADRIDEDRGLDFLDVTGPISITGSTLASSTDTNAHFHNIASPAATLTVTGSTITNAGNAGMRLIGENASEMTANVSGNTFTLNQDPSFSMQNNQGTAAKQTLVFDNNDVSGGNAAGIPARPQIGINSGGGGSKDARVTSFVKARISNNDIKPSLGAEVILNTMANASSSSTFDAVVQNNVIADDRPGAADPGVDSGTAIWGWAHGAGVTRISILNNTVKNWGSRALELSHNDGSGTADYTVAGNTLSNPDTPPNGGSAPFEAIYAFAGGSGGCDSNGNNCTPVDTSNVCIDMDNNDMDGIGRNGVSDLALDRFDGATLRFAGVNSTDIGVLQSQLRTANPASPAFTVETFSNTQSDTGATTCATPQGTP